MIRIEIQADTPRELQEKLMALAIGATFNVERKSDGTGAETMPVVEEPKAEEKAAPKPRVKKSDAVPAVKTGSAQTSDAKSAPPPGDFDVEGVDPTDKDSVRAYLSASIDILGGPIVTQVFGEFGATSFKGVAPEQYAPMIVRLDELRKAAEAEAAEKGA